MGSAKKLEESERSVLNADEGVTADCESKEWARGEIYHLMRGAPQRITYSENSNPHAKSFVWEKFKIVCIDNKPVNFVKCNDCISVFQWTSKQGTGNLNRHQCVIPQSKIDKSALAGTGQMQITQVMPRKAPRESIELLNDTIVTGLAKDLRPLRTVDSRGFKELGQALITFGAKYGNHKISDVVKCPKMLKERHLSKLADNEREKVKRSLMMAPSNPNFTFTFDLWTENKKQRHFLSLTCHYVDSEFTLQSKLLGAQEFPSDKQKTTANIRYECSKLLGIYFEEATVTTVISQSIAVTDGGSNVTGVFLSRLPCMCHKLNLILDHTFSDKILNLENYAEVKGALSTVKSIVKYFKQSGLNSQLTRSLKQTVPTRWNSHLTMLESYKVSAEEVKKLLLEKNQLNRLVGLNEELVVELIELLKPFDLTSKCFSAEKVVTIDKVVLERYRLDKHLQDTEKDSNAIKLLKVKMREYFQKYYALETSHFAALLLNPRFKSLRMATDAEREAAHAFIRDKMTLVPTDLIARTIDEPALAKIPKLDVGVDNLADSSDEDENATLSNDELTLYIESRFRKPAGELDVLDFWKDALNYPTLRKVALWILSIPASSTSDERTFSVTGQILSDRRSQLGGSTVSDLTILHKNM